MSIESPIEIGEFVRVSADHETTSRGLEGLTGQIVGVTELAVHPVDAIGSCQNGVALQVQIGEETYWLDPTLLTIAAPPPGEETLRQGRPLAIWLISLFFAWSALGEVLLLVTHGPIAYTRNHATAFDAVAAWSGALFALVSQSKSSGCAGGL